MSHDTAGNFQFQSTASSHKSLIRQVELVHHNKDEEEKQLLLSLPKWNEANQLSVSVMVPECRQEKIEIILNKVSQPLYSLSDPVNQRFPAVVRKDQRAVPQGRKRDARGNIPDSEGRKSITPAEFMRY